MKNSASAAMMTTTTRISTKPSLECECEASRRLACRGDVLDDPDVLERRNRGPASGAFARAAHHQRTVERVREELHEPRELQQGPTGGDQPLWPRHRPV